MMAADLQKFPQTDFYKGLGKLTDGFLRNDREFLDAVLSENEADCHPERRPQAEAEGSRAESAETDVAVYKRQPYGCEGMQSIVQRLESGFDRIINSYDLVIMKKSMTI